MPEPNKNLLPTIESGNPLVTQQLEALASKPEQAQTALRQAAMSLVARHPDFKAFKDPDYCPEGFLIDEEGKLVAQMACRTKEGDVKALRVEFLPESDEEGNYVKFSSKPFSDEFPF